ncbi:hypothetical protein BCR36DRAFT_112175, partial [Piromyces finnis]
LFIYIIIRYCCYYFLYLLYYFKKNIIYTFLFSKESIKLLLREFGSAADATLFSLSTSIISEEKESFNRCNRFIDMLFSINLSNLLFLFNFDLEYGVLGYKIALLYCISAPSFLFSGSWVSST